MVMCCHKFYWVKKAIRSRKAKGNVIEDWFGLQKRLLHRVQIKAKQKADSYQFGEELKIYGQRTNETIKVRVDLFCQSC